MDPPIQPTCPHVVLWTLAAGPQAAPSLDHIHHCPHPVDLVTG